jgi:hypothetical protein
MFTNLFPSKMFEIFSSLAARNDDYPPRDVHIFFFYFFYIFNEFFFSTEKVNDVEKFSATIFGPGGPAERLMATDGHLMMMWKSVAVCPDLYLSTIANSRCRCAQHKYFFRMFKSWSPPPSRAFRAVTSSSSGQKKKTMSASIDINIFRNRRSEERHALHFFGLRLKHIRPLPSKSLHRSMRN